MIDDINKAALHDSSIVASYMPRPRLNNVLEQATLNKLVYIIAGAGHGKTQAVRHYMQQKQDAIVRWMQLTDSDNIGSRYWESYTHTVSCDNPELAVKLRELGFPETLPRFKQFAEILKTTEHPSRKIFFVFDDFHLIYSKEVLLFTERCTHLQIPGECVIVISRNEPDINIINLHSKGNVSIITENELRFTDMEISEFLRQQGTPVSPQNHSQLIHVTKGWALAINMFSVIFKKTPNNIKYALDSVMTNIFKLFESEAWDAFNDNTQKAIVRLSLLSDLPIMPLREILDDEDLLHSIPELSTFIWFSSICNDIKIHPLYLEFLQSKQHILPHDEKLEIYQRAARWCFENSLHMDAIRYYAKSNQYEDMIKALLSYPIKLPRDVSEYFFNVLMGLDPGSEEHINLHVSFLKGYFAPLLLVGLGKYKDAKEKAITVIREWENINTPFSMLLLHTAYSNLAYIDMYTCTLSHKYDAPEHIRKSIQYYEFRSN